MSTVQSFDTSKLFFAVVNSTRDHVVIDAVSNGAPQQQLSALQQLLLSTETPRYLLSTLQLGYNIISSGGNNFHTDYTNTSLKGSGTVYPSTNYENTSGIALPQSFDPIVHPRLKYDAVLTNSKVYVGD